MAVNHQYNYAHIDTDTGLCVGVRTMTYKVDNSVLIPIRFTTKSVSINIT